MAAARRRPEEREEDFGRLDRPPSLTARVEQLLRQAIAEGRFPAGRLPTEAELASQLGVSRETVRLAAEVLQREGLLVKIRRRGTFVQAPQLPDRIEARETPLAAYLQASYQSPQGSVEAATQMISALMLQGAVEEASTAGLRLVVQHSAHTQVGKAFDLLQRELRPSAVIFASYGEEKLLRRVAGLGLPTVLVDHDVSLPQVHTVCDDSFTAARQAVLELAALGHRRIALAHWRHGELNPWRRDGYREGLRAAALPRRRTWEIEATLTEAGARQAVGRFLELTPRPTALYCFNNSFARLVIAELVRRGLAVPDDVSILGGGGEEVPGLTCHQADWLHMGRRAVEVLVRALDAAADTSPEHHRLPHVPRPGQTTAAPRT